MAVAAKAVNAWLFVPVRPLMIYGRAGIFFAHGIILHLNGGGEWESNPPATEKRHNGFEDRARYRPSRPSAPLVYVYFVTLILTTTVIDCQPIFLPTTNRVREGGKRSEGIAAKQGMLELGASGFVGELARKRRLCPAKGIGPPISFMGDGVCGRGYGWRCRKRLRRIP